MIQDGALKELLRLMGAKDELLDASPAVDALPDFWQACPIARWFTWLAFRTAVEEADRKRLAAIIAPVFRPMVVDKIEDLPLRTKSEELLVTLMDFGAGVSVGRTTVEQMWLQIEDRLETLVAGPSVPRSTVAYMAIAQTVACLGRACMATTTSDAATWGMDFGNNWSAVLEMAGQNPLYVLGGMKTLLPYVPLPAVENATAESNPWAGDPWP
jgi:hypothetical protein